MRGDRTDVRGCGGIQHPDGMRCLVNLQAEAPPIGRHHLDRLRLGAEEQPGLRRAALLRRVAGVSAVLGLVSVYPLPLLPAALAAPLGLAVWLMARRDAAAMRAGRRNRRWMGLTLEAQARGLDGMVFSAMAAAFWSTAWLLSKVPWPF